MFNWFGGIGRCFSGKHEKSEKHLHATSDDRFVSRCRYCGTPLKRRAKRDWIVISRAQYRAERRGDSSGGLASR